MTWVCSCRRIPWIIPLKDNCGIMSILLILPQGFNWLKIFAMLFRPSKEFTKQTRLTKSQTTKRKHSKARFVANRAQDTGSFLPVLCTVVICRRVQKEQSWSNVTLFTLEIYYNTFTIPCIIIGYTWEWAMVILGNEANKHFDVCAASSSDLLLIYFWVWEFKRI